MKSIRETFEDNEHIRLSEAKKKSGCKSWREFILHMLDVYNHNRK